MLEYINVVTLPRTCFAVIPTDYICDEEELKINKLFFDTSNQDELSGYSVNLPVEQIVTDEKQTLYVNLAVRKCLLVEAKMFSGKVQAQVCNYHVFTNQDAEDYCLMSVRNVLHIRNNSDGYFDFAKDFLRNALDFDLISENDYVQMTYKVKGKCYWKESVSQWNVGENHKRQKIDVVKVSGMMMPAHASCIHLKDVLMYSNNRSLSQPEANKIKSLLSTNDSEKIALTLLNVINPRDSFPELMCLINHMNPNIRKNSKIAILPLLKGAYNVDAYPRTSDYIVKEYTNKIGHPSNEILERIADNYYHPNLEESSVFDFKLKIKRR